MYLVDKSAALNQMGNAIRGIKAPEVELPSNISGISNNFTLLLVWV